jgi:small subunit ribosomal protein S7
MPRRGHVIKRDVLPDPIYGSKLVTNLINTLMESGKKGTAQSILYSAFVRIEKATGKNPEEVFTQALANIKPVIETKSKRIGGQNIQAPVEVRPARKQALGLRWLVQYARLRKEKTMEERLAKEIIDASQGLGAAVKKREDVHKMAEANKAFSHLR